MKPNDKAYREFMRVFNKTHVSLEGQIMASLTAAYAAQFQSEDYAELVERLRKTSGMYQGNMEIATWLKNPDGPDAADAIEMLLAKMNSKPKPSGDYAGLIESLRHDISDPTGKMMSDWDSWRKYIASGGDSSWPRDQFEGHLDSIAEIHHSAADAIEALLAERDALRKWKEDDSAAMRIFARYRELEAEVAAWKGRQEATAAILKQVETERDALKAANNELREENELVGKQMDKFADQIESLETERDAANGRVHAAELHAAGMTTQRDCAIRDRDAAIALAEQRMHGWVDEGKEKDALAARLAPVDDKELVEIAAHFEAKFDGWPFNVLERLTQDLYRLRARDFLAAIRPHIEAAALSDLVEFSKHKSWSLNYKRPFYCDDDQEQCWIVYEEIGPINDRDWNVIGKGETAAEAIAAALKNER